MRIIRLKIENINSLAGVHEIDFMAPEFVESGIFAITGPTGSGKTTILDAITLGLFGVTPRSASADKFSVNERDALVVTKGQTYGSASVVFEAQGRYWRSTWSVRAKTRKGSSGGFNRSEVELVELPSAEATEGRVVTNKKNDWENQIKALLNGVDLKAFTRSVLLAQGAFSELLKSTSGDRVKLLEKITGTGIYTAIGTEVHQRVLETDRERDRIEAELKGLTPMTEEARATAQAALVAEKTKVNALRTKREALSALLEWKREFEKTSAQLNTYQTEQAELEAERPAHLLERQRVAAARAAVLPIEVEGRRAMHAGEEARHRQDEEKYAVELKTATQMQGAKQAALKDAEAHYFKVQADYQGHETEWQAIETMDAAIAKVASERVAKHEALAKAQTRRAEAQKNLQTAEAQFEKAQTQEKSANEKVEATAAEAELPTQVRALQVEAQNFGQEKAKFTAAQKALEVAQKALEAQLKKEANAKAAEEAAKASAQMAKSHVREAQASLEIALAGSTFEKQVATMRERTGCYWAGMWLMEIQALLTDLAPIVAMAGISDNAREAVRRAVERLNARALMWRGRFTELEGITAEELKRLRAEMDAVVAWSKKAGEAQSQLDAAQRAEQGALEQAKNAQVAAQVATERKSAYEDKLQAKEAEQNAAQAAMERAREVLENKLRAYMPADWGWQEAQLAGDLQYLEGRAKSRLAAERWAQETKAATNERRGLLLVAQETARTCETEVQEALAEGNAANVRWTEAQEKRQKTYGARNVREERAQWNALREEVSAKHKEALRDKDRAESEVQRLEGLYQKAQKEAALEHERAANARVELERRLAEGGFEHIDAARAAWLASEDLSALERKVNAFMQREAALAKGLEDAKQALAKLEAAPQAPSQAEREASIESVAQAEAGAIEALETAVAQVAQMQSVLDADDALKQKNAETVAHLNAVVATLNRWAKLDSLVGGVDGKNFNQAAQRLTFHILLKEANEVLREMQSRYELTESAAKSFEIYVRDMDLAGIERSATNLSGGETFLVSLSLAIALSRVNTRHMQMDTLFLDEGFGSLDPVSLEKALSALETLQQRSGKLIGLISHVAAVRDRVGVQIRVRPQGSSGQSLLEGPGVKRL